MVTFYSYVSLPEGNPYIPYFIQGSSIHWSYINKPFYIHGPCSPKWGPIRTLGEVTNKVLTIKNVGWDTTKTHIQWWFNGDAAGYRTKNYGYDE